MSCQRTISRVIVRLMHPSAIRRRRPSQLVDSPFDSVPNARRPEDFEIDQHIGQRVRERRIVLGLRQTALADGQVEGKIAC